MSPPCLGVPLENAPDIDWSNHYRLVFQHRPAIRPRANLFCEVSDCCLGATPAVMLSFLREDLQWNCEQTHVIVLNGQLDARREQVA